MNELEIRLEGLAATGQTMTYGALARDLGWRMGQLTAALETLMEVDSRTGRPLRAALCAGKVNGGLPANGFFLKAEELGYFIGDREVLVASERAALFKRHI